MQQINSYHLVIFYFSLIVKRNSTPASLIVEFKSTNIIVEFNSTIFYHFLRDIPLVLEVSTMANQKHLSNLDRIIIDNCLKDSLSFKAIARKLNKDCTTISKEVRNHLVFRDISSPGRIFNNCIDRFSCKFRNSACSICTVSKSQLCKMCKFNCRKECDLFVEEVCAKLSKPPYVCNGCNNRNKCTLTKHMYYPLLANQQYQEQLSESRKGIVISQAEIDHLNDLLYPLIVENGQSIHHVFIHHKDEIMMSEKTLYKIIDAGILKVRNIDLPRQVTYKKRRKKSTSYKIDSKCRTNRTYQDFLAFCKDHPDGAVVQMDSVEGRKGEACLLTVHFTVSSFMIAVKRDYNDAKSVIDFFNHVYDSLGKETFQQLFPVILADNGSEFSNPEAIEFDQDGARRTYVFYCDPSAPYQKGSCEVNHELLRRIVPKGKSFNPYNQKDINVMMSHVNSYARDKLNDKSPYFIFTSLFSKEITSFFGIECIASDDIKLKPSLISKNN